MSHSIKSILSCGLVGCALSGAAVDFTCESLSLDLRACTAPDNYIWVCSGRGTCAPLGKTVGGVSGFFAPPVAAGDLRLSIGFIVNGHAVPDAGSRGKNDVGLLQAGAKWRPDALVRRGTYHFRAADAGLLSFSVDTQLAPCVSVIGFGERVTIRNRGDQPLVVQLLAELDPGHPQMVPLGGVELGKGWDYCPPKPGDRAELPAHLLGEAHVTKTVAPGASAEWLLGVRVGCLEEEARGSDVQALCGESTASWARRLAEANARLPRLTSDIPGLEAYYARSVASGLVSLWDSPDFAVRPFPMTSGMDGGSLCCYPWDSAGYGDLFLTMLLGDETEKLLKAMLDCGMDKHIAMSLDGSGQGWCPYSYSAWSVMNLYWTYCVSTGKGAELFEAVLKVFQNEERRLPEWRGLKDYGVQHNLLEMRSCGWERVVSSPNAERAWCFDRLADLGEKFGKGEPAAWHAQAAKIRRAIRDELWDGRVGWFRSHHPEGDEIVYSIQAFDAVRMGACTEEMARALFSHVRDGAFLGKYGVSSVSAEDERHYELIDIDWSGNGSYSGDGPNLAETLWCANEPELAFDVLSRDFWMGTMLPYIPQEHYVDRPMAPEWARANIIAGAAGMQAVLKGMAGLNPRLDGTLTIAPKPHVRGAVELRGYLHRGRRIDLRFGAAGMSVAVDGKTIHDGPIREISL